VKSQAVKSVERCLTCEADPKPRSDEIFVAQGESASPRYAVKKNAFSAESA